MYSDHLCGIILLATSTAAYVILTLWLIATPFFPALAEVFPSVRYPLLFFGTTGLIFIGSVSIVTIVALWKG
uniref:Dolichol phosphate-mannose biosynthesis regulatory protein n=1 Tax=Panstrongylus lignarius TaxID=156445 RepID=A0A224XU36_9HEMI